MSSEDQLDRHDLDAWEVEALPDDFEDRVLARLESSADDVSADREVAQLPPLDSRASAEPERSPSRAMMWGAAAAAALTLLVGAAVWQPWAEKRPTPIAASSGSARATSHDTTIQITPDVQARLTDGAAVTWETKGAEVRIAQAQGEVRYDVRPATPVSIHTAAGRIDVTGTRFSVELFDTQEIADMTTTRSHRLKTFVPLAAGATAIALVAVHQGSVDASNDRGSAEVEAGEQVVMTDRSGPRAAKSEPESGPVVASRRRVTEQQRQAYAKTRRKIAAALERRAAAQAAADALGNDDAAVPEPPELLPAPKGSLDKEYIRTAVREDLIPLAQECYSAVLELDPEFGGKMVLEFEIMGDEDVGGIVDNVQMGEGTDVVDPEFIECMSESMMTVMFEPPEGGGTMRVTYPMIFEPGPPDGGGDAPPEAGDADPSADAEAEAQTQPDADAAPGADASPPSE